MPTLPAYNSKQNIQANTAEPLRNEAAQPFQDQQKIIGTLADITKQWSDANDVMQYTNAKASYETSVAKIQLEAASDTGITLDANGNQTFTNNTDKYKARISEVQKNAANGISNQQAARKAMADFNYNNEIVSIKIDSSFNQKRLDFNKSQVSTVLAAEQAKIVTGSDNEILQARNNIRLFLNTQVATGILSPVEAKKSFDDSVIDSAEQSIFVNTDKTINDLKNKDGIYKDMPADKRVILINRAEDYKKRLDKEVTELQKEASLNNESNIVLNISQGGSIPDASDMAKMVRSGSMESDFAEAALKAQTSPDAFNARTDGEEFSKLTMEIMKSSDKDQLRKSVKAILKGGGDGKISKPDMQILVQSAIAQGKQNFKQKQMDGQLTVESLGNWADESKMPREEVFREFQKNVSDGDDLNKASEEAKKKVILNTIEGAAELTDVPNIILGKDNQTRYIFPKKTNISANRIYQLDNKEK